MANSLPEHFFIFCCILSCTTGGDHLCQILFTPSPPKRLPIGNSYAPNNNKLFFSLGSTSFPSIVSEFRILKATQNAHQPLNNHQKRLPLTKHHCVQKCRTPPVASIVRRHPNSPQEPTIPKSQLHQRYSKTLPR